MITTRVVPFRRFPSSHRALIIRSVHESATSFFIREIPSRVYTTDVLYTIFRRDQYIFDNIQICFAFASTRRHCLISHHQCTTYNGRAPSPCMILLYLRSVTSRKNKTYTVNIFRKNGYSSRDRLYVDT